MAESQGSSSQILLPGHVRGKAFMAARRDHPCQLEFYAAWKTDGVPCYGPKRNQWLTHSKPFFEQILERGELSRFKTVVVERPSVRSVESTRMEES